MGDVTRSERSGDPAPELRGLDNRELYIVPRPYPEGESVGHGTLLKHPGAMWREPDFDRGGREAWCIALPNRSGMWWTTYEADGSGALWDVTGTPPNLTVNPSINAGDGAGPGNWHGWIKDGVMTP